MEGRQSGKPRRQSDKGPRRLGGMRNGGHVQRCEFARLLGRPETRIALDAGSRQAPSPETQTRGSRRLIVVAVDLVAIQTGCRPTRSEKQDGFPSSACDAVADVLNELGQGHSKWPLYRPAREGFLYWTLPQQGGESML